MSRNGMKSARNMSTFSFRYPGSANTEVYLNINLPTVRITASISAKMISAIPIK